jgi:hypothetical protein
MIDLSLLRNLNHLCSSRCERRYFLPSGFSKCYGRRISTVVICVCTSKRPLRNLARNQHLRPQILWTLYFTAEEGSITLDVFNSFGTGGLTGPGRRRTVIGGQGVARSGSNINNGYAGYGSPNVPTSNLNFGMTGGGPVGSGIGGGPAGSLGGIKEDPVRSQHSLSNKPVDAQSMTSMGAKSNPTYGGGVTMPQTAATGVTEASAPLMTGSSGGEPTSEQTYSYRAKALYNCAFHNLSTVFTSPGLLTSSLLN